MIDKTLRTLDSRLAALMKGGNTIVELGCGDGHALDILSSLYKTAIGIDVSEVRLKQRSHPPHGWRFIQSDLNMSIPLEADSVDLIFANQVIEHIADPVLFIKEIRRVLSPSGYVVLTTPNIRYLKHLFRLVIRGRGPKTANDDVTDGPWDNGHINYFTHQDLERIFFSVGFLQITTRALIDINRGRSTVRSLCNRFSGAWFVKEFLSGNILLTAMK